MLPEEETFTLANGTPAATFAVLRLPEVTLKVSDKKRENLKIVNHVFYVMRAASADTDAPIDIFVGSVFMYHIWGIDMQELLRQVNPKEVDMKDHPFNKHWSEYDLEWRQKGASAIQPHPPMDPKRYNNINAIRNRLRIVEGHGGALSITPHARFDLLGYTAARKVGGRRFNAITYVPEDLKAGTGGVMYAWQNYATEVEAAYDKFKQELHRPPPEAVDPGPPPDWKPRPGRNKLTERSPRKIYKEGDSKSSEYNLTQLLSNDRHKDLQRRLNQRKVRLLRAAYRVGIPRDDPNLQALIGTDQLNKFEAEQVKALMAPYLREELNMDPDKEADDYDLPETPETSARDNVEKLLKESIERAADQMGVVGDKKREFHDVVWKYREIFATDMDGSWNEAARVPPLKVQLVPNARPQKVRMRSYPHHALQFLQKTVQEMEKYGLLYKNDNSVWAAPVGVIPKPGKPGKFRMIVDLRWTNHVTQPVQYGFPLIDEILYRTKGAKYFFVVYMLKAFWQVMIDPDSQEYFSFMTPDGVYTPTRLMMGGTDSPMYFQAAMTTVFKDLVHEGNLAIWIDDLMGYGKDWDTFINVMDRFLAKCVEKHLLLDVTKSVLGDCKAHWCGRDIDSEGVSFRARRTDDLLKMEEPTLAGELCQFLQACNWMRGSIPNFSEMTENLWEIKRRAETKGLADKGSRRKKAYDLIPLKLLGWGEVHSKEFQELQNSLTVLMKNGHFDPEDESQTLCLLTDASQRHYAALLTSVTNWKEGIPVEEQEHRLLRTFSGEFKGAQVKWSTIEKESFPIIEAVQLWRDFLMISKGFNLYSDHENLVTLFRPDAANPELSKSALDKVYRWCYTLSRFRINHMEHLPGQRNVWADLLSRWAHPTYKEEQVAFQLRSVRWRQWEKEASRRVNSNRKSKQQASNKKANKDVNPNNGRTLEQKRKRDILPRLPGSQRKRLTEKEIEARRNRGRDWNQYLNLEFSIRMADKDLPGIPEIKEAQDNLSLSDKLFKEQNAKHMQLNHDGIWMYDGKVWIPDGAMELKLYAMIMAHCGFAGHRGQATTAIKLKKWGYWPKQDDDLRDFCGQCRLCTKSKTGETVPRPWGQSVSGTKPGEVIHFDYMYITPPADSWYHDYKYVLVIKDDYTGMVDLWPAKTCDHDTVVKALQHWESIMGRARILVSDRGSHFKNRFLEAYVRHSKVLYNPLRPNHDTGDSPLEQPQVHHFTMAYCPWANGTVENVNKHLKALLQILTKEARLSMEHWPSLLPVISGILNSSESYRNVGYSPRQLFMGEGKAFNPLDVIYNEKTDKVMHLDVPRVEASYKEQFTELMSSLELMHKKVNDRRHKMYDRDYWGKAMANRSVHSDEVQNRDRLVDFTVGDFVMVATPGQLPSKLSARWRGPYEVVRCIDEYIYEVRHLVTGKLLAAHIMRIKFFCNSELDQHVALLDEITSHENYDLLFTPEGIEEFRYDEKLNAAYVKVKWLGFSSLESTWEYVDDIARDFPELTDMYFGSMEGLRHAAHNPRKIHDL